MAEETQLYAVQTGQTVWEAQARLEALAGVPLSDAGRQRAERIGKELVPHEPTVVYSGPGQAESESARLLGGELGVKVRRDDRLCELDFGLWQGLTIQEVKHRHPSLWKQWQESPASVRPPGGESLDEAAARAGKALRDILKKERNQGPVLVLRPVVLAVVRCLLDEAPLDELWDRVNPPTGWVSYTLAGKTVATRIGARHG
jgi:broad specificity phosphatase PhoE